MNKFKNPNNVIDILVHGIIGIRDNEGIKVATYRREIYLNDFLKYYNYNTKEKILKLLESGDVQYKISSDEDFFNVFMFDAARKSYYLDKAYIFNEETKEWYVATLDSGTYRSFKQEFIDQEGVLVSRQDYYNRLKNLTYYIQNSHDLNYFELDRLNSLFDSISDKIKGEFDFSNYDNIDDIKDEYKNRLNALSQITNIYDDTDIKQILEKFRNYDSNKDKKDYSEAIETLRKIVDYESEKLDRNIFPTSPGMGRIFYPRVEKEDSLDNGLTYTISETDAFKKAIRELIDSQIDENGNRNGIDR